MRALAAALLLAAPSRVLAAQAVPRTDTPRAGTVRATFDARIETWEHLFLGGSRIALGAPLTGDTVGGAYLPPVARLEADVRTAARVSGFVASLGAGALRVRAERRTTPLGVELGITDRLAIGATVPVVRVNARVSFALAPAGASLGLNPLIGDPAAAEPAYAGFFGEFDAALTELDGQIASGACVPRCAEAQVLSVDAHAVRDALRRSAYGPGTGGGAPFLPLAASDGGAGIAANVTRIQQELGTFGVAGFTGAFLLPDAPLNAATFAAAYEDPQYGFGAHALGSTPRRLRFWAGDVELALKYRAVVRPAYAAALGLVWRLPTGHQDSPHDPLDLATGDRQTDVEAQLVQELVVANRLWLNLSVRAARQLPGERDRRVAAAPAFLVSRGAWTRLSWDPGDYLAADVAPLYRLSRYFAAGVTAGYWTRKRDRYAFLTIQDSVDLAARLGAPTDAAVLNAGTSERRLRLGAALTYVGPSVEGGMSIEQTVSGTGGAIPAGAVFRILLRTSRKLF